MSKPLRSQIFLVDEPEGADPAQHFYVVISNNQRNASGLENVLALMITTTSKAHLKTAVALASDDPVTGYVVGDDIVRLWSDELTRPRGYLSAKTMQSINIALQVALALEPAQTSIRPAPGEVGRDQP